MIGQVIKYQGFFLICTGKTRKGIFIKFQHKGVIRQQKVMESN